MTTVLEGFLVRVGFDVDKTGFANFQKTAHKSLTIFRTLAKTAVAVGTTVALSMLKASSSVAKLYHEANNSNTSIANMQAFANTIKSVGGSAEMAKGMIGSLAEKLKMNPKGITSMMKSLGVDAYDANGQIKDTVQILMELREAFKGMDYTKGRLSASVLGIDGNAFDMLMKDDVGDRFDEFLKQQHKVTENVTEMSRRMEEFQVTVDSIIASIKAAGENIFGEMIGITGIDAWAKRFSEWLSDTLPGLIKGTGQLIRDFLNPEKSGESWHKGLKEEYDKRNATTDLAQYGITADKVRKMTDDEWAAYRDGTGFAEDDPFGENGYDSGLPDGDPLKGMSRSAAAKYLEDLEKRANKGLGFARLWDKYYGGQIQHTRAVGENASAESHLIKSNDPNDTIRYRYNKNTQGFRTNNFGNLRGSDGKFRSFATPEEGYLAAGKQLVMYANAGIENIESAISKWAPSSENATPEYIKAVAAEMSRTLGANISGRTKLDFRDPTVLKAMVDAIVNHENGGGSDYFQTSLYKHLMDEAVKTKDVSRVVSRDDLKPSAGRYDRNVTVNQTIRIDGARSPSETARRVATETRRAITVPAS